MPHPTVAILGASEDRRKFGNKSVRAHQQAGYEVFPIHPRAESVEGAAAYPSLSALPVDHIDRIVLYLPPSLGVALLEEIAGTSHDELWVSPGAESDELLALADDLGLQVIRGCTIIDTGVTPADLDD